MKYEELIKRLRTHNGWALNETLDEAADAIEELLKKKDCPYWGCCPYWFKDGGFCSMLGKCDAEPPKEKA